MSLPTINHFQSLGVTPTTPFDEIKRAYRKLSLKYHPDKTPNKAHHEKFKEINAAFEVIRTHFEKFKTTSNVQMPTSNPNTTWSAYQQYSTSNTAGHPFSSRQYYSRYTHEHTASNVRNGAGANNSKEDAYFQAFHKSREQQRKASQQAAEAARRERERLVEILKAEAEAKRKEEMQRAEIRKRELEKMEEERKRQEAAKQRQQEEQRKEQVSQGGAYTTEAASNQNQSAKSSSKLFASDSDEEYNPYDHKQSHANGAQQNQEYQDAKQRRRDMVDAAETANDFLRNQVNPDDTEKMYKSKKGKPRDGKDDYVPSSKRQKNDRSSRTSGAKSRGGASNPIILEDDYSDIEPINISDGPYISDDEDEDEVDITGGAPSGANSKTTPRASPKGTAPGTKNGSRVPPPEKTPDPDLDYDRLDDYIPSNVKPKVPPRNSSSLPPRPGSKNSSASPGRAAPPPKTTYTRHRATSPHKRSKISTNNGSSAFDMGNFDINVGDIEDIDFRELSESLPGSSKRKQPTSSSANVAHNTRSTRSSTARFTDGTSRAETLSTPLNKNSVRGHSATSFHTSDERSARTQLSVLDFHASATVHNFTSPQPPSFDFGPNISRNKWIRYKNSMMSYQESFLEYKKHIVQYQEERMQKDFELFNVVNDLRGDQSNLAVYNQCLKRDLEVITQFQEALRVFTFNMELFRQNCQWVKVREQDPHWS